jgi:thiol:disulfide interchange protein DsbD
MVLCVSGAAFAGGDGSGVADRDASPAARSPAFKPIKSRADLQREVAAASASRHPVMIWVRAQWALSALEMENKTFSDPAVISATSTLVLLRADITNFDSVDKDLLAAWDLRGAPAVLFYGADGTEQRNFRVLGFMKAAAFAAMVRAAGAKAPLSL